MSTIKHPFLAAARHLGAAFVLGGASTLLMRAVQRNATLGFRALDAWRGHVTPAQPVSHANPALQIFEFFR